MLILLNERLTSRSRDGGKTIDSRVESIQGIVRFSSHIQIHESARGGHPRLTDEMVVTQEVFFSNRGSLMENTCLVE